MNSSNSTNFFFKLKWNRVFLFGLPLLIWQILFFFIPFLFLFIISFWQIQNYQLDPDLTLKNYSYIFTSPTFWASFVRSLRVSLTGSVISIIIAYPFVYGLVFYVKPRYSKMILGLSFIPLMTSYILRSYSWRVVFSENGLINVLFSKLGLISLPIDLQYSPFSTILGLLCYYFPISVVFLYISLSSLNKEIILAAKDLGASTFRTFILITFPLSIPAIIIGFIFTYILTFADFITPTIVGGNSIYLYSLHFRDVIVINNWPRAAAMGIFMIVFVIFLIVTAVKLALRKP